jgi:hypothetical protein
MDLIFVYPSVVPDDGSADGIRSDGLNPTSLPKEIYQSID